MEVERANSSREPLREGSYERLFWNVRNRTLELFERLKHASETRGLTRALKLASNALCDLQNRLKRALVVRVPPQRTSGLLRALLLVLA